MRSLWQLRTAAVQAQKASETAVSDEGRAYADGAEDALRWAAGDGTSEESRDRILSQR